MRINDRAHVVTDVLQNAGIRPKDYAEASEAINTLEDQCDHFQGLGFSREEAACLTAMMNLMKHEDKTADDFIEYGLHFRDRPIHERIAEIDQKMAAS